MAVKIRMTRGGSKNRPYYTIIATDSRSPRDSSFLEKLGSYNPTLPKDSAERFKFDSVRVQYWLDKGAKASDLVARYLVKAGILQDSKKTIALRDKAKVRQQAAKKISDAEASKKAAEEAKAAEAAKPAEQPAEAPKVEAEEAKPAEAAPAESAAEAAPVAEAAPEPEAPANELPAA